jgi:pimeloyl-ACP methyl ester carboxylesterase
VNSATHMEYLTAYDGTRLAYRAVGSGPVLVCVPGGPGQAVEYLGDLGGLAAHRTLILLDNRGVGASQVPDDPASYRVERLVDDVEALRLHLGLDRMDLFGHSASGGTCMLYAARYPQRLRRLVLACPSLRVTGLPSDLGVDAVLESRSGEPWFAAARHALDAEAGTPAELERYRFDASALLFGEWNDAARAYARAEPGQFAAPARDGFYAGFVADPALPAAPASLKAPVLLIAGEVDIWPTAEAVRQAAALFGDVRMVVQAGAGHFGWIDDPATFARAVEEFLARSAADKDRA